MYRGLYISTYLYFFSRFQDTCIVVQRMSKKWSTEYSIESKVDVNTSYSVTAHCDGLMVKRGLYIV